MNSSDQNHILTRRLMLSLTTAMFGTGLMGNMAHADGGGGGEKESQPSTQDISTDAPSTKKKGKKTRVMFTKKNYHRISTKGLKTAISGIDSGDEYWIEGFTKKMSKNIFEMTLIHRRRTLLIFKKMLNIKTREKRLLILEDEIFDVNMEIERLERGLRPKSFAEILKPETTELTERMKARLKQSTSRMHQTDFGMAYMTVCLVV